MWATLLVGGSLGLVAALTAADAPLADAGSGREPKVIAKTNQRLFPQKTGHQVIRNGKGLARALGIADEAAAERKLAAALKVDDIDWNRHMVVFIDGGRRPTGGYAVELIGFKTKGKALVVNWKLRTPPPDAFVTQAITYPSLTLLVERCPGEVAFNPPASKKRERDSKERR